MLGTDASHHASVQDVVHQWLAGDRLCWTRSAPRGHSHVRRRVLSPATGGGGADDTRAADAEQVVELRA